jgi:hypothetical protein
VESKEFALLLESLSPRAKLPSRRALKQALAQFETKLRQEIADMAAGSPTAITVDGWTSVANQTYYSTTRHFIDEFWELVSLSLECHLHVGAATQTDIRDTIVNACTAAGVDPVCCTTDCEPSMVAAGRLLLFPHLGCIAHRLETITGVMFDGPGTSPSLQVM